MPLKRPNPPGKTERIAQVLDRGRAATAEVTAQVRGPKTRRRTPQREPGGVISRLPEHAVAAAFR